MDHDRDQAAGARRVDNNSLLPMEVARVIEMVEETPDYGCIQF